MLARKVAPRWHSCSSQLRKRWVHSQIRWPITSSLIRKGPAIILVNPSLRSQATGYRSQRLYSTTGARDEATAKTDADNNEVTKEENVGAVEEPLKDSEIPSTTSGFLKTELDRHLDVEEGYSEAEVSQFANLPPEIISYPDPISSNSQPVPEHLEFPEAKSFNDFPHKVPDFCPGCGAKSHSEDSHDPGYYGPETSMPRSKNKKKNLTEKSNTLNKVYMESFWNMSPEVRELMRQANMKIPTQTDPKSPEQEQEQEIEEGTVEMESLQERQSDIPNANSPESKSWFEALENDVKEYVDSPEPEEGHRWRLFCCRCRNLLHHTKKLSDIPDATFVQAGEIIKKSPFNRIHIYHVIDAADFPLSVIPQAKRRILDELNQTKEGRKKDVTMSYVITRADVLTPTEPQANELMTYMRRTLGAYLGEEPGLKDLRMVSSKRVWTTERMKDEVRARKSGIFLLGRTNVGKSRLYEAIFPKRNTKDIEFSKSKFGKADLEKAPETSLDDWYVQNGQKVQYPEMPLVSRVPGTTVGPISIDFAAGRGQLVDLPGFSRSSLIQYIREEHQKDAILIERPKTSVYVVKGTQTLILGGLITIKAVTPQSRNFTPPQTPTRPGKKKRPQSDQPPTIIVHSFTNLPSHVSKDKKVEEFTHVKAGSPRRRFLWAKPEIGEKIKLAGKFKLTDDVTQKHVPSLPGRGKKAWMEKNIVWKVMATDILISGYGWLEITAQMRKDDPDPEIEVWSPDGEGIGQRETMGAYHRNVKSKAKSSPGKRSRRAGKSRKPRPMQKKQTRAEQAVVFFTR